MTGYRGLGRTSDRGKAPIRSRVTALLYHEYTRTTETRAKEIRKAAGGLIAMTVKEKGNFEIARVTTKVTRKGKGGRRVKEIVDDKKVTVYDEVGKEVRKNLLSGLHARGQVLRILYGVTEVPAVAIRKKKDTRSTDLIAEIFGDTIPKYVDRNSGYIRIVKIG